MKKKKVTIENKEYYETLIAKKQYEDLTKKWYKKLESWKTISWIAVSIVTALIMYANGLFDFRTKELELINRQLEVKKDNLESDIKKFASIKDSLFIIRDRLAEENQILTLHKFQLLEANKQAFAKLDDRGKHIFSLSQELTKVHRRNQQLEDEIENSKKISFSLQYTGAQSYPWINSNTSSILNQTTFNSPFFENNSRTGLYTLTQAKIGDHETNNSIGSSWFFPASNTTLGDKATYLLGSKTNSTIPLDPEISRIVNQSIESNTFYIYDSAKKIRVPVYWPPKN